MKPLCSVLLLLASSAMADVKLSNIFADDMVLQRDVNATVYGTADDGETVTATIDGKSASATAKDGQFLIKLPEHKAGGPYTLTVKGKTTVTLKNVLYGDIWLAGGQSNMAFKLLSIQRQKQHMARLAELAKNTNVRILLMPIKAGSKVEADIPVSQWIVNGAEGYNKVSAAGYVFGAELAAHLKVPVAIIHCNKGGSAVEPWMSKEALKKQGIGAGRTWYNAMVGPMLKFPIRGVVWYQGESNGGSVAKATRYGKTFPAMIQSWRDEWKNPNMTFLFIQLAGYAKDSVKVATNWPVLRESQNKALALPKTGVALAIDIGAGGIHPGKKFPLGIRLFLAARGIEYGEDIVYSGPMYKSMTVKGSKIVLTFNHTGSGMIIRDGDPEGEIVLGETLKGFVICGADKKFLPAQAKIVGKTVVVSHPDIKTPVAARYGWTSWPEANLYNKENLPASPFRTDTFVIAEAPKPVRKPKPVKKPATKPVKKPATKK